MGLKPSVLGNLCWGRALGVYLAEGHLALTELATTLAGRKVRSTCHLPIGEGGPGKTLAQWLESNLTPQQRRHLSVCIGLAAEQIFFTTRTFEEGSHEAPTAATLLAASGGASLDPANATTDYIRSKLHRATIYQIAACRRDLAEELGQTLKEAGIQNARLEPAPCSLLDMAGRSPRPARGWKTLVRVFLSNGRGLAMLVVNGKAVLWRRFAMTPGQESRSIASAVRHVELHAFTNLGIRGVTGICVQGKIEPSLVEQLRQEVTAEVVAVPGAEPDEATYSLALALSARKKDLDRIDLFKAIRPPLTMAQMFPRQLAAGMLLAAGVLAAVLWYTLADLDEQYQYLCRQNASFKWAQGVRINAINLERKSLSDEVSAIQRFLGTRAIWSNYLRDLPTRLPSNSCLQSLTGDYEMKKAGKGETQKASQSLTICGMARFADRGSAPKEIDAFLESLRGANLLKRMFPVVNLAEIKWRKDATADIALFTIIAIPKEKSVGSTKEEGKSSPGSKEEHAARG